MHTLHDSGCRMLLLYSYHQPDLQIIMARVNTMRGSRRLLHFQYNAVGLVRAHIATYRYL